MPQTQQTFVNRTENPIYISVEPWPECFELEPTQRFTIVWDAPDTGDTVEIDFINEHELVIWPSGKIDTIQFLIDDIDASDRSWTFKHK